MLTTYLLAAAISTQPSPSSGWEFYRGLANAIATARGSCEVSFFEGKYRSSLSGSGVVNWTFNSGTRADVDFDYQNSALVSLKITFNKPVMAELTSPKKACVLIKGVEYSGSGSVTRWDVASCPSHPAPNPNALPYIEDHLAVEPSSSALALGRPFDSDIQFKAMDTGGEVKRQPVRRLKFYSKPDQPALAVLFKNGAQLDFGKKVTTTFTNTLTLASPSRLTFNEIVYNVEENHVRGQLSDAVFTLQSGTISTNGLTLLPKAGSRVSASLVRFDSKEPESGAGIIRCEDGTVEATLAASSFIAFENQSANSSFAVIGDGTSVSLDDLDISISDTSGVMVKCGNDSKLNLFLIDGNIAAGDKSFFGIKSAQMNLSNLAATWSSKYGIAMTGKMAYLNIRADSSEFMLEKRGTLRLVSGALEGNNLTIDTVDQPVVQGKLSTATVMLERSNFAVPNGPRIDILGGTVTAPYGLEIRKGVGYPVGVLRMEGVAIHEIKPQSGTNFSLKGGNLTGSLELNSDGTILSPRMLDPDTGEMKVPVADEIKLLASQIIADAPGVGSLKMGINLDNGTVQKDAQGHSVFEGNLSGELQAFDAAFTTPGSDINGDGAMDPFDMDNDGELNNDARIYPIRLKSYLNPDMQAGRRFGPAPFKFSAITREFKVKMSPPLKLEVLQGRGEYIHQNVPHMGYNTDAPEHIRTYQEVFRDTNAIGPIGSSTIHFYLINRSYDVTLDFNLGMDQTGGFMSVSGIALSPAMTRGVGWERDGSEAWFTLLQWGAGFLKLFTTAAQFATLGYTGITDHTGTVSDDRIDGRVNQLIAGKVNSLSRLWKF